MTWLDIREEFAVSSILYDALAYACDYLSEWQQLYKSILLIVIVQ